MANLIKYSDSLRKGTDKLNDSIKDSNTAFLKANQAAVISEAAKILAESVQEQFNQVVIEGDSSVEAAQARVNSSGVSHPTLKSRLDNFEFSASQQLAEKVGDGNLATMGDLSQEVKAAMTGGSVAIVGDEAVLETNIVDKQVTPRKTSFLKLSSNLFDKTKQTPFTIVDNSFLSSGVLYADKPDYFVLAPISVDSSKTYSINAKIWGTLGTAVAINAFSSVGVYRNGHNTQTFTTPSDCSYIQITVDKKLYSLEWIKENLMLVEGSVIPNEYKEFGYFLDDAINLSNKQPIVKKSKIFVNISNESLKVLSNYNNDYDIRFSLAKRGVNNIFDFLNAQLILNSSNIVSNDLISTDKLLWSSGTDTFGPHVISALNNADGDNISLTDFTGGNHGYDGNGTMSQSATGRTSKISFKLDDELVTEFSGYANELEVVWENFIQANNTKKINGNGREVLKEKITLSFDGKAWKVNYQSELLEDAIYSTFYGLQLATTYYKGGVLYPSSLNRKWNLNDNIASNSGDKLASGFVVRDTEKNNFASVEIDKTIGLGQRKFLSYEKASFHTTNKAYMFLIGGNNTFEKGDIFEYRGTLKFSIE